jgi:3-oxoadipate enol-lactonase
MRVSRMNLTGSNLMQTVASGNAQLRYEHAPRPGAPALLFINSLGAALEMWDDQVAAFSDRFECVRYDVRGHGKSTAGTQIEVTLEQLARDALAVLDACGIARAHICGLSLGGMTAMKIAHLWPDRVLKLVLANTSAHMPPRENWQARIDSVRAQGLSALADGTIERWFTPEFRTAQPEKVARVRQMISSADPQGYAACAAAIRDMDLRADIGAITTRTLVIAGARDPATPLSHAELIASKIAGAKLVTLDCAHLSNVECAAEFNAALCDFLAAPQGDAA